MRKRDLIEELETRVWNLFGVHWIIAMENKGWVYPRDPDSGESGDETKYAIVQLFIVGKEGERGDYSRQVQMANDIIADAGNAQVDGVLVIPILALCHDLWEDQGVIAAYAHEITDPAEKARFLQKSGGFNG